MLQPPDSEFDARVVGFDTGLVGSIGVRIIDNEGNTILARTTVGVIEDPAGSGSYVATLVSPTDPGDYSIMWDINNIMTPSTTAYEDLTISGGYVTTEILPGEILANLGDINANLPSDSDMPTVVANSNNTSLLQVSIARVVRGYLSRVITTATLVGWTDPSLTPEIIREAAGKLIASQLYFNKAAAESWTIEERSVPQRLYDEGMAILNGIIAGTIILPDTVEVVSTESMTLDDGWPIDNTDRSFTKGMIL